MKHEINPFPVSSYEGPQYFCNRRAEISSLLSAIKNGRNVTLHAIRRMGKSALIQHLFYQLRREKTYLPIYVDIMYTTDMAEFTNELATQLIAALKPSRSMLLKQIQEVFKAILPTISIDPMSGAPKLSFRFQSPAEVKLSLQEIFDFLKAEKRQVVVAIDEFQQIAEYEGVRAEALLRKYIQQVPRVRFIFSGSRRHLLLSMFSSAKRPFFASTDSMPLETIAAEDYGQYIRKHLGKAGKTIEEPVLEYLFDLTQLHTHYIHNLCNRLYDRPQNHISRKEVNEALYEKLEEESFNFSMLLNVISPVQKRVLIAIAKEGRVEQVTASAFLHHYRLNGSSVLKSLKTLEENESVYRDIDGGYQLTDVFLMHWLRQKYR